MTIEREHLEAKLREIQEVIDETTENAKSTGMAVVGAIAVVALVLYLFGRRRGRKAATRVEVYRLR